MDGGLGRYFSREYYRQLEKRFAIKTIVYCWWFNFLAALAVFNLSMYLSGDMMLAIMYTLVAWTMTLTVSIVYWLMWIQRQMKGGKNVKIVASSVILVMFVVALLFIFRILALILQAARL
jgi:hypothetical protein